MNFQDRTNLAYSTIPSGGAPSPTGSGNSIKVASAADRSTFPTPPFMATVWPPGVAPTLANAEIVQVNGTSSTDAFVMARAQGGTTAKNIVAGYQIAATITTKPVDDLELAIAERTFITVSPSEGGNYVTDGSSDEIEINAAIDEANAAGGGTVLLKAGTYTTTGSIVLKSNVHVVGEGKSSTFIVGAVSDYRLMWTTLSGTTKTLYEDIFVSGICFKSNYGSCLVINNTSQPVVKDCEFTFVSVSPTKQALYFQHCQNALATDNYVHDVTGNGISMTATDKFVVSNNLIIPGTLADDAIDIDYDFGDTSSISSNYGSVFGNVIRTVGLGNGIRVENSNYVNVVGNSVSDVTTSASISAGILINTSSTNTGTGIMVDGNTVIGCVAGGIAVSGTNLTDVSVNSNTVINCGQDGGSIRGGIILNATGVMCANNTVDTSAKTGADGGAIVIYKKGSHSITGNTIRGSVTGLRAWNGDALQSYTGMFISNNYFATTNTSLIDLAALASDSLVFNNYGLQPITTAAAFTTSTSSTSSSTSSTSQSTSSTSHSTSSTSSSHSTSSTSKSTSTSSTSTSTTVIAYS